MSFKTVCPHCDSELTAPDTVLGKRVKCKKCGDPFTAKRAPDPDDDDDDDDRPAQPAAKARPRPARDEDDDDSPPRKSTKARRPADDDDDDEEDDDEPRPKAKKKGKKKQKQGLPMALVLGILAGVLLIGGGIVAYFGFIKEDKPTDPVVAKGEGAPATRGKERGGPGAPGTPSAWVEHVDGPNKYRIKFPKQPTTKDQTVNAGGMQQTIKAITAQVGTEVFVCNAIELPAAEANIDPKVLLDAAEQQAPAQIPGGATVTSKKDVTQGGATGRELTLSLQGGAATGIVRLFVTNGRIYTIAAVGPGLNASSPNVITFFESLKFDS
jgi:hypothetical protein